MCFHIILVLFSFQGNSFIINRQVGIIGPYFLKLLIYNVHDGVPEAKAYQKQRHTAADTEYGHKEPLFIAEQVTAGCLPGEGHGIP